MNETTSSDPELIRRFSETTLHAAEKGRRKLFNLLTRENAEKIEKLSEEKLRPKNPF